jgi:membrane protease YdiL (CAAX protease family)
MAKYIIKSALFCIVFTGFLIVFSFAKNLLPSSSERLAHGIVGTIAGFLTLFLFLRFDKKRFSDIGLQIDRKTILRFLTGVGIGIIIMGTLATGVLYMTNTAIRVNPAGNFWNFLLMTAPLILLAFMEELGFRTYPLEILKDKVGVRTSLVVTSVLFALYHIANGWTIAASFYGPGVWGLVFGLAAVYSKGIAMPTGIHYAANLTTAAFADKGNTVSLWIVGQADTSSIKQIAPEWVVVLAPSLALFVFAVFCIRLYMKRYSNIK